MASTRCFCGSTLEAADDDALVALDRSHLQDAHGLTVSAVMTRNAIERQRQLGPVPPRAGAIGAVTSVPVMSRVDDFVGFFDDVAFTDNVGWASCYCLFHHIDPATWEDRSWQQNRTETIERIRSGATTGVVAYVDGAVAGWVNASRLSEYPAHRHGDARDDELGAIVCFVVAPQYRGHGLAGILLDAACELLRDAGLTGVEAYPSKDAKSAAAAYHGTSAMFARAGFTSSDDGTMFRSL